MLQTNPISLKVKNSPLLISIGREVSKEDGELYAKEKGARYFESSAKTGKGVQEAVSGVCEEIFKKV